MYKYKAFGLIIASEIILSELVVADPAALLDVEIKLGNVPDTVEDIVIGKGNKKISRDQFRLDNKGIAKYYVEKGNLIILEPYDNCLWEEVKLYLLGSCIGALLHQRKILPLHGSCINVDGQGVLLTGDSGAGKSTIAAAFFHKGYKMVTDDVAATTIDSYDRPLVYPSYPSQKLWEDAIERLDRNEPKRSLNRISKELSKYAVDSHHTFCYDSTLLRYIFEIVPESVEELKIEEITGVEKIHVIVKNTYRRFMIKAQKNEEWHFKWSVKVASQIEVYRIARPVHMHAEKEIAERILEKVLKGGEEE